MLWLGEWERLWQSDFSFAVSDFKIRASLADKLSFLIFAWLEKFRPEWMSDLVKHVSCRSFPAGKTGQTVRLPRSPAQH